MIVTLTGIVVFICIYLMLSNVEHLFRCLLDLFPKNTCGWLSRSSAHFVLIYLLNFFLYILSIFYCMPCVCSLGSVVSDSRTSWTVAHQSPLSMGFSRQRYCSGLPSPLPGHFSDPRIEPMSPTISCTAGGFFTTEPLRSPFCSFFDWAVFLYWVVWADYIFWTLTPYLSYHLQIFSLIQ